MGALDIGGLCFITPQPDRHQLKMQDHGCKASASRGMPVYSPAFTGTH